MHPKSQRLHSSPLSGDPAAAPAPPGPDCNGLLYRMPRRTRDRMSSLFKPVRRCACQAPGCGWEGNLSVDAAVRRHAGANGARVDRS